MHLVFLDRSSTEACRFFNKIAEFPTVVEAIFRPLTLTAELSTENAHKSQKWFQKIPKVRIF